MHRTTTAAALLVTVAVSALTGCVTVQRPPTAGPPGGTARSQPSAPRPDGSAEPRVVQAPAREALEMVGPSRRPERKERAAPSAPAATPSPGQSSSPRAHPHPRPRAGAPRRSRSTLAPPDVCALGRQYGGWPPDSPESHICERTYGR
ncbi:hypothetical protein [Streptomyces sp. NPDC102462]|uniref:hypothetical protein n=1 Tax=Streptomyces sp. NPDC102462 TaxID=3366178 RepID=UPI00382D069F